MTRKKDDAPDIRFVNAISVIPETQGEKDEQHATQNIDGVDAPAPCSKDDDEGVTHVEEEEGEPSNDRPTNEPKPRLAEHYLQCDINKETLGEWVKSYRVKYPTTKRKRKKAKEADTLPGG